MPSVGSVLGPAEVEGPPKQLVRPVSLEYLGRKWMSHFARA